MGLDIIIVEHKGYKDNGDLIIETPKEDLPYSTDRYSIRKEISKNVDFKVLNSGKYYDPEEYYRPTDFKKAYEWVDSIEDEGNKDYLIKLFKSLEMNPKYYLEYNYWKMCKFNNTRELYIESIIYNNCINKKYNIDTNKLLDYYGNKENHNKLFK